MTALAQFEVVGLPKAQGSKKAFVIKGKNGAKPRAAMAEDSGSPGAAWRDDVAQAAKKIADRILDSGTATVFVPPFDGALTLHVTFRFPMPKSRTKAQRERGEIPKTSAPDTSKLVRSVEDSLQAAGLIVDDARFVEVRARKIETVGWTGAVIQITRELTP